MKYQNIFWLDDYPIFLHDYLHRISKTGTLPKNITFAFDYEMGKEVIDEKGPTNFDLFMLNADFPDMLNGSQRMELNKYVKALKNKKEYRIGINWLPEIHNFEKFYNNVLKPILTPDQKVVVNSGNNQAIFTAFSMNLPFYLKYGKDPEIIKNLYKSIELYNDAIRELKGMESKKEVEITGNIGNEIEINEKQIKEWEHGGAKEFVEEYLEC